MAALDLIVDIGRYLAFIYLQQMLRIEALIKAPFALATATLPIAANGNSDALFASDAQVFKAIAKLGGAWRSSPTLADIPRPAPPGFMPYRFDQARSVFIHRRSDGQINRIVLGDLGC